MDILTRSAHAVCAWHHLLILSESFRYTNLRSVSTFSASSGPPRNVRESASHTKSATYRALAFVAIRTFRHFGVFIVVASIVIISHRAVVAVFVNSDNFALKIGLFRGFCVVELRLARKTVFETHASCDSGIFRFDGVRAAVGLIKTQRIRVAFVYRGSHEAHVLRVAKCSFSSPEGHNTLTAFGHM